MTITRTTLILTALLTLTTANLSLGNDSEWKTFSPADGSLTVQIPGQFQPRFDVSLRAYVLGQTGSGPQQVTYLLHRYQIESDTKLGQMRPAEKLQALADAWLSAKQRDGTILVVVHNRRADLTGPGQQLTGHDLLVGMLQPFGSQAHVIWVRIRHYHNPSNGSVHLLIARSEPVEAGTSQDWADDSALTSSTVSRVFNSFRFTPQGRIYLKPGSKRRGR